MNRWMDGYIGIKKPEIHGQKEGLTGLTLWRTRGKVDAPTSYDFS